MKNLALLTAMLVTAGCGGGWKADLEAGKDAYDASDYELAISYLDEALEANQESSEAFSYRGSCRSFLGDVDGAVDDCTEAIRLAPESGFAYRMRGIVRQSAGRGAAAAADYDKAIALDPDDYKAMAAMAGVMFDAENFVKSEEWSRKSLEISPDFEYAKNVLAETTKIQDMKKGRGLR